VLLNTPVRIVIRIVIRIVSSRNLRLWVRGLPAAFIAAIVIAVVETAVRFVLAAIGGRTGEASSVPWRP
jgi:uncharacterized BrkB/YihY/UPF0761 family membrane protein